MKILICLRKYLHPLCSPANMSQCHNAIPIGDRTTLIDLPETYLVDVDDEGTVNAVASAAPELFTLRFSVITVGAKDPEKTKEIDLAADAIAKARKRGSEAYRQGDKAWFSYEEYSVENGEPVWFQFWEVGHRNRTAIFSLCCSAEQQFHPQVKEGVSLVPEIIESFRLRDERSPLTSFETEALEEQRSVIAQLLQERFDCYSLPRLKADLPVLQRILEDKAFTPEQEYEWSCLGVAFGDILAGELGLDWIAYCDEQGAEPALSLPNTSIVIFPRTMILKRVESGETADLEDLFQALEEKVGELRSQGC